MKKLFIGLFVAVMSFGVMAQDPNGVNIWDPAEVRNINIKTVAEQLDAMIVEVSNMNSTNVIGGVLPQEMESIRELNASVLGVVEGFCAIGYQDSRHSKGDMWSITYDSMGIDFDEVASEVLRSTMVWYSEMMKNLTRSPSADIPNSIWLGDCEDFRGLMAALTSELDVYEQFAPINMQGHSSYERGLRGTTP